METESSFQENQEDTNPRRIKGLFLWLGRILYLMVLFSSFALFIIGTSGYLESWKVWSIDAIFSTNTQKEIVIYPIPNGDSDRANIKSNDILLAINDTPTVSINHARNILKTDKDETISITILRDKSRSITFNIKRSQYRLVKILDPLGIKLESYAWLVWGFEAMIFFAVIGISVIIFWRRSNDWLALLIAALLPAYISSAGGWIPSYGWREMLGASSLLWMLERFLLPLLIFLFPNGHFVPQGIRYLLLPTWLLAIGWTVANWLELYPEWILFLWLFLLAVGAVTQIYRYARVSTLLEKQQSKWIIICFIGGLFIVIFQEVVHLLPNFSPDQAVTIDAVTSGLSKLFVLFVAFSLISAIDRYNLWDVDFYLNRTIIYSLVMGVLAITWGITFAILDLIIQKIIDQQNAIIASFLSSVQVVALFQPVRQRVEKWINASLYKDRVNYEEALFELKHEMWPFLCSKDVLTILVKKVPLLLQSKLGAIFLADKDGKFKLIDTYQLSPTKARSVVFSASSSKAISVGKVAQPEQSEFFELLIPLTVSRTGTHELIGVLALGARTEGRGYSRDHINDLKDLGEKAGVAFYMLKLKEKTKVD